MSGAETRHGTTSGYNRHQQAGERPCDPCFMAKREYDKRRLAASDNTQKNRLRARAQAMASSRMRNLYPGVYAALYAEAKAELGLEAKR